MLALTDRNVNDIREREHGRGRSGNALTNPVGQVKTWACRCD
jgi:hypothetical protein